MDNNNSQTPPTGTEDIIVTQSSPKEKGNSLVWIIAGFVVILIAGGTYWYMNKQKEAIPLETAPPVVISTPQPEANLDEELNEIPVQASEGAEFDSVNADLKTL